MKLSKYIVALAVFVSSLALFAQNAGTNASVASSSDQLQQLTAQLQNSPDDEALRGRIIALALTLDPKPATPDAAIMADGAAVYAFKNAQTNSDFSDAAKQYEKALLLAPWNAADYFNCGVAHEKAGENKEAIRNFNLYLLAAPDADDAQAVKMRIGGLQFAEQKVAVAAQAQADVVAATEEKEKQTQQVLDALKSIVGDTEYWWHLASIGSYTEGGRQGLNMQEYESDGVHWWTWGDFRSKYVFRNDKVYVCLYAANSVYQDMNTDKAQFIGTPNGPSISDIVWEYIPSYDQSGKPQKEQQVWVNINEDNGNFTYSPNRPLSDPDRDAVYSYWMYQRKETAGQKRRDADSNAENDKGIAAYNKKDWITAISYFKEALQDNPADLVQRRNLAAAQYYAGEDALGKSDNTVALNYFQQALANDPPNDPNNQDIRGALATVQQNLQKKQQDKNTAENIHQSIQNLSQTLNAAPETGGLDFMSGTSTNQTSPAPGAK